VNTSPVVALLSILVAIVSLVGGPLAAYVAVRVGLATVTVQLTEIARRLERYDQSHERTDKRIGGLERDNAQLKTRVSTLERLLSVRPPTHDTEPPPSDEDEQG